MSIIRKYKISRVKSGDIVLFECSIDTADVSTTSRILPYSMSMFNFESCTMRKEEIFMTPNDIDKYYRTIEEAVISYNNRQKIESWNKNSKKNKLKGKPVTLDEVKEKLALMTLGQ